MAECLQGHGFEIIRCTCLIVLVDGLVWFFRVRDARLHLAKEPLTGLRESMNDVLVACVAGTTI